MSTCGGAGWTTVVDKASFDAFSWERSSALSMLLQLLSSSGPNCSSAEAGSITHPRDDDRRWSFDFPSSVAVEAYRANVGRIPVVAGGETTMGNKADNGMGADGIEETGGGGAADVDESNMFGDYPNEGGTGNYTPHQTPNRITNHSAHCFKLRDRALHATECTLCNLAWSRPTSIVSRSTTLRIFVKLVYLICDTPGPTYTDVGQTVHERRYDASAVLDTLVS